jgi:catechol 2,3-dioxygenase-like lactoylglutathione lyase family enzyme
MPAPEPDVAMTNTAHLYARVSEKERLLRFFTDVLGLSPRELSPRKVTAAYVTAKEPMYAVAFANGAGLSVEFTDDALTDQAAERGAWLELTVTDRDAVEAKAQAFGAKRIVHPATPFLYLQAPGGQVFRIVGHDEQKGS